MSNTAAGRAPIRVGIIGLEAGRSWAAMAHLPGLRAQPQRFVVTGVANRTAESARAAAAACGIPRAFDSVADLAASPDIDLISVTVRVPQHRAVLEQAIGAGKAIYCEWPLARDFAEAQALTRLAAEHGIKTCIGLQGTANPQVQHLAALLRGGAIGRVLSHTITGHGRLSGAEISDERTELYLLDKTSGADMLSISVGHTLAVLEVVGGKVQAVQSLLDTRRKEIFSHERGAPVPMTAADQVALHGYLADGSVFSLHYRGGLPLAGPGFVWEIEGERGTLRITAASGAIQIEELHISMCSKDESAAPLQVGKVQELQFSDGAERFRPVPVPEEADPLCPGQYVPGNVGRMYALLHQELAGGSRTAPDFFDALRLHGLLARIQSQALRAESA